MLSYLQIYQQALDHYIAQTERTHPSLIDKNIKKIYPFGFFSRLRHSQKEYVALQHLREQLAQQAEQGIAATQIIRAHFTDKKNKWNNHSFNNYLLDEIRKSVSNETWEKDWQCFDKKPIVYYKGFLFRGTNYPPEKGFHLGLYENNTSKSLEKYIKDMSGAIGISTSKSFDIAHYYALPHINLKNEAQQTWYESYIYLIDYQGELGIDLKATFKRRHQILSAFFSANKEEVNVIHSIPAHDIIGAFYVNRSNKINWQRNPDYMFKDQTHIGALLSCLPQAFAMRLKKEEAENHFTRSRPS